MPRALTRRPRPLWLALAIAAALAACAASGAALVALGVPADAVPLLTLPWGVLAAAAVMEAD